MRTPLNEVWMRTAWAIAGRSTCARRKVGCVLLDEHNKFLASGYNGTPRMFPHCTEHPCGGQKYKQGKGLEVCEAVHAEQNALLQCADVNAIATAYCTTAPCIHCVKLLLNTTCQLIVIDRQYCDVAYNLWHRGGRQWLHHEAEPVNV